MLLPGGGQLADEDKDNFDRDGSPKEAHSFAHSINSVLNAERDFGTLRCFARASASRRVGRSLLTAQDLVILPSCPERSHLISLHLIDV